METMGNGMKKQCAICEQTGDMGMRFDHVAQAYRGEQNPLSWYAPASAFICQECFDECRSNLVAAVNDAAMARSAERQYASGIDYVCGYRG